MGDAMKRNKASKLRAISGHGAKLPHKIDQAVVALMSKPSIEAAAKAIGVSGNTLLRWLKHPQFQAAYSDTRVAVYGQSVARLQNASGSAVETLIEIMRDKKKPPAVRVRAADLILTHAAGIGEMVNARAAHVKELASKG